MISTPNIEVKQSYDTFLKLRIKVSKKVPRKIDSQ